MRSFLNIVLIFLMITAFSVGVGYFLSSRTSTETFDWSKYSEEQIGTAKLACVMSMMAYCSENSAKCDESTCKFVKKKKDCKPTNEDYDKFITAVMDSCTKKLLRDQKPAKKHKKRELLAKF